MPSVVATILTGNRPDLLEQTLEGSLPYLKRCQRVLVLHNGNDVPTAKVLDRVGKEIDLDVMVRDGEMMPSGPATSILMVAAAKSGCDLNFHLEDDWSPAPELVAAQPDWFEIAQEVAMNPAIGQVRLRRESDLAFCSPTNWIDGRGAAWSVVEGGAFMVAPHHWTQNPSIQRCALLGDGVNEKPGEYIRGVYPAESERHAMARFYALNLLVAQMRPGVYAHLGDGRSLENH